MKRVIVSGYFNPLHGGHLDMIEEAKALGDYVIVIVNNDKQQMQKKGKVILDETNRTRLMGVLKPVDEVFLSIDVDTSVIKTLKRIAEIYPEDNLIFANGGDRDSKRVISESQICDALEIELVFGVGSGEVIKRDSSSRINQELGHKE